MNFEFDLGSRAFPQYVQGPELEPQNGIIIIIMSSFIFIHINMHLSLGGSV